MKRIVTDLETSYPIRDLESLYASSITINCSKSGCIPCAYKVGNFDVALDSSFSKRVPNIRPELCPRTSETHGKEGTYGYRSGMKVLTLGDGDFSFSLALARIICSHEKSSTLIATSYESLETLLRVYPNIQKTIDELRTFDVRIYFEVDATNLKTTLPIEKILFHRIVWNFPCTAIKHGQDGQNNEMAENLNLIKSFVKECESLIAPSDGEIHMIHKTKPPYNQWSLSKVALEDYQENPYLTYQGRVVFDKCLLPPYTPRKALDRKSFPVSDACCYVFGSNDARFEGKFQPTIPIRDQSNHDIVRVTKSQIETIRDIQLTLGSYHDRKKFRKH